MSRRTPAAVIFITAALLPAMLHADDMPIVRPEAPPAGTLIAHPRDGRLMAWVPAGNFIMGMDAPEAQQLAEDLGYDHYHQMAAEEWFPQRTVYLPGYFIDVHEVTAHDWRRFVERSGHVSPRTSPKFPPPPDDEPLAYALNPVTRVLWCEARQYANFYGKALPSEAQWEKAARGVDGRRYPWGDDIPRPGLGAFSRDVLDSDSAQAWPVGSFPDGASPYGLMDMAGNVYEWTADWFEPYPNNPEYQRLLSYTGHTNGVLRGGSFYHVNHSFCSAKRFGFEPDQTYFHVGFRTVWEPPHDYFQTDAYQQARDAVEPARQQLQNLREKSRLAPSNY